jgi:SAM-dependent methyltransferase
VLRPVLRGLEEAPGRVLADVGGGTGNYAAALAVEGWEPLVIDRSRSMLALAAAKGLRTIEGDAHSLPLENESIDALTLISVLHHLDDPAIALAEARRVLRPGGRAVVVAFTREDISDLWLIDNFPISSSWMDETHPPLSEIVEPLPGATGEQIVVEDLEDASIAALASFPELVLQPDWRRQTSYFERLERDHPRELDAGLERLRRDLDAGSAPDRPGRASAISWVKPG